MTLKAREDWGFPNPATPPGSSAYYGIRFSPPALRDPLAALHGWHRELRGVLDRVSDPGVASAKLGWWREELKRCFDGHPSHPLGRRLAAAIELGGLPPKPFLDIAWSTEAALSHGPPKDSAELTACAAQDLGALFELVLRLGLGAEPDPEPIAQARRLGAYATVIYAIRDSGWRLRQGRVGFLPADRLTALGTNAEAMVGPEGRHRLPSLLSWLATEAQGLRGGPSEMDGLPVILRIRIRILDRLLAELAETGFDLVDRRLSLTPLRKFWIAWGESRRRPTSSRAGPG